VTAEERLDEGVRALFDGIQAQLERAGIAIEFPEVSGEGQRRMKVVVVAPDLKDAVDELSQQTRDQVVMVRVDQDTLRKLDAWMATGAVKSRSEAAALFIQEGLKVREAELSRLEAAIAEVDAAKERLRKQAREVFGGKE
jgi:chromosome segregation ATPase